MALTDLSVCLYKAYLPLNNSTYMNRLNVEQPCAHWNRLQPPLWLRSKTCVRASEINMFTCTRLGYSNNRQQLNEKVNCNHKVYKVKTTVRPFRSKAPCKLSLCGVWITLRNLTRSEQLGGTWSMTRRESQKSGLYPEACTRSRQSSDMNPKRAFGGSLNSFQPQHSRERSKICVEEWATIPAAACEKLGAMFGFCTK